MLRTIPLILAQTETGEEEVPAPRAPREEIGPGQTTTTAPSGETATGDAPSPRGSLDGLLSFLPLILIFVLFWFILMGGQRREKKKRAKMLAGLAKGAKVQTIGGIMGTVVEIRENEVVVKVDENSNTRIKFNRSAIQSVMEENA